MAVLVIGGRSKIGSALIEELLVAGESVRALVRENESATAFPDGVGTVVGDLGDRGSLANAIAGTEKVFLLSSAHRNAVSWHKNAIDAAPRQEYSCWCAARFSERAGGPTPSSSTRTLRPTPTLRPPASRT